MSGLKKIVVFTATGDQGGSVCKYLIESGKYEVIGISRNPESDSAKALTKLGVKVHKGDLEDVASYTPALEGIYGAFVNADFWVKYFSNGFDGVEAGKWEYGLSSKAIEACVKAGAKHIVYSTLDNVSYVPHFSYKNDVSKWADGQGYPMTHLYTSHYISNLVKFDTMLTKQDDGTLQLAVPASDDTLLVNFAVEQTGGWVEAIFNDLSKFKGQRVDAGSEEVTLAEWAKVISEITGKTVKTLGLPAAIYDDYTSLVQNGVPEEMILNYKGFYERVVQRDIAASKAIYTDRWDTRAWAKATGKLDKFKA